MAPLRFMATGPWGAEPVPTCSTAAAVDIASKLFARIMAGEIDILGCTGVDGAPGLPPLTDDNRDAFIEGSAAAWRMVQARARRHVDLPASATRDAALAEIARIHLRFGSLVRVNSDDRDFREVAVWQVRDALNAAFAAGLASEDAMARRRASEKRRARERAPDCTTAVAAQIAGIIAGAVMAGEMDLGTGDFPADVARLFPGMNPASRPEAEINADLVEAYRVVGLMISARARASVRTPSNAALSAAEAALALAEDALDGFAPATADPGAVDDFHAAMGSIADTLRAGLDPLHAVEGHAPHDARLPAA